MSAPIPRFLHGDVDLPAVQEAFNQFQQETIDEFEASTEAVREGILFPTAAAGDPTVRLNSGLRKPAKLVLCGRCQRTDGTPASAPWSIQWTNLSATEIAVTFTGLAASTEYSASFLVR